MAPTANLPASTAWLLGPAAELPSVTDPKKLLEGVQEILRRVLPDAILPVALYLVAIILLVLLTLGAFFLFVSLLSRIRKHWMEDLRPIFYDAQQHRRSRRRQRFAEYIANELRRLNTAEEWSDYRFAELDAEVEAEGERRRRLLLPSVLGRITALRRERSLSKGLDRSTERLVLLEGEPGSGKSVALRHVALTMAERARRARNVASVIPVYVNLKELRRTGEPIDRELIESFVIASLNRLNDRDITRFLEDEFTLGIQDGTWVFLLDSFDEIPEILSSTEPDVSVQRYAAAIEDFLSGWNRCRAVVASRHFRGPRQLGWARFRVLSLSEGRRKELVRNADLPRSLETELLGGLATAPSAIAEMVRNPMFLGLLCEYVRAGRGFPQNAHEVFQAYTQTRLSRDQHRLRLKYTLSPPVVRATAERVAFCMGAEPGLGLSPTREQLKAAMHRHGLGAQAEFERVLDALEFIKLARSESPTVPGESRRFTFSHRRFQEYFATCLVLREPDRVTPSQLLMDGRWREAAVVMCQVQPRDALVPLIDEATRLLKAMAANTPGTLPDGATITGEQQHLTPSPFPWPSGCLHLLSLLQDGFSGRLDQVPDEARRDAASLLVAASVTGDLTSRKYALEVAGIAPEESLVAILRRSFRSASAWLRDAAYRQAARLQKLPSDVAAGVRDSIVRMAFEGRLGREREAINVHLGRLDSARVFILTARVMRWLLPIDLFLHTVAFLVLAHLVQPTPQGAFWSTTALLGSHMLLVSYRLLSLRLTPLACVKLLVTMRTGLGLVAAQPESVAGIFNAALLWLQSGGRIAATLREMPVHPAPSSLLLIMFCLWWAPATIHWAGVRGLRHWLVVPVTPLVVGWKAMRALVRGLRRLTWQSFVPNVREVVVLLLFSALMIGVVAGIMYLMYLLRRVWGEGRVTAVFGVFVLTFLALSAARVALSRTLDLLKWYRGRKRLASMNIQEFLGGLRQFRTARFTLRFISAVRRDGLLVASEETERLLRAAVVGLEQGLTAEAHSAASSVGEKADGTATAVALAGNSDSEGAKAALLLLRQGRSIGSPALLLDELAILLEAVRARRLT